MPTANSSGRRSKKSSSFAEFAAIEPGHENRLRHMEHELDRRIVRIRDAKSDGDTAVLFFELDCSIEELEFLSAEVGAYLSTKRPLTSLFKRYPRVVIGSLVAAAMWSSREGTVWPHFWEHVGAERIPDFEQLVRKNIRAMLAKTSLANFANAELGRNEYVSLFLLHAGLTVSQTVDIISFVENKNWSINYKTTEELAKEFSAAILAKNPDRESLREFIENAPVFAHNLFTRAFELIEFLHITDNPLTDFEGTNGLPVVAFRTLLERPEKNSGSANIAFRSKDIKVKFHPLNNTVYAELPPLNSEAYPLDAHWIVTTESQSSELRSYRVAAKIGQTEPRRLTLAEPFKKLTVELSSDPSVREEFYGVTKSRPFLVFGGTNHLIPISNKLTGTRFLVIAPNNTKIRLDNSTQEIGFNRSDHGDWPGWQAQEILAPNSRQITFIIPGKPPVRLPLQPKQVVEWETNVQTLSHARTLDEQPVYAESPRITLRGNPDDLWRIKTVYEPVDGSPELVIEEEIQQTKNAESVELCPADLYSEAWVGRFKATVFRNGVFADSLQFSIAERFELKASSDQSRTGFRFRNVNLELQKWSYTLHNNSGKRIKFNSKTKVLGKEQANSRELISTDEGYGLEVRVQPSSLVTRYKYKDSGPVEATDCPEIRVEMLDASYPLTVHFPRPVSYCSFHFSTGGRQIRTLEQAEVNLRRLLKSHGISARELAKALGTAHNGKLIITWSSLSREHFVQNLTDLERKSYFALSRAKQDECYLEQARNHLLSATVAVLQRRPLVASAEVEGSEIIIQKTAGVENELLAWAWMLGAPEQGALALSRVANGFILPPQIRNTGALLVEFREEVFLGDTSAPTRIARDAVYVEQAGMPLAEGIDWVVSCLLLGETEIMPQEKRTFTALWKGANILRDAEAKEARTASRACWKALCSDARTALEASCESEIGTAARMFVLIRSGVVLSPFTTSETSEYPVDDVFVSVLGEIADAGYLRQFPAKKAEFADSLRWVELKGSPELLRKLQRGTEAPTQSGELDALIERYRHLEPKLAVLGILPAMKSFTEQLVRDLSNCYLVDFSVLQRIANIKEATETCSDPAQMNSRWIPYISYVTTLVARLLAYRLIDDGRLFFNFRDHLSKLALIAEIAPDLFEQDLLSAEAIAQTGDPNRKNKVFGRTVTKGL